MAKKEEEIIVKIKSNASEVTKDSKDLQEQTEKTTESLKKQSKANDDLEKSNSDLGKSIADNTVVTKKLDEATGGLYSIVKNLAFGLKDTVVAMYNNTKATIATTTATKASTVATGGFRGAINALKVAIASNPLGLLLTALSTVVAYFAFATDASDEFNKSLSYSVNNLNVNLKSIDDKTKLALLKEKNRREEEKQQEIDDNVSKELREANEVKHQNNLKDITVKGMMNTANEKNKLLESQRDEYNKKLNEYYKENAHDIRTLVGDEMKEINNSKSKNKDELINNLLSSTTRKFFDETKEGSELLSEFKATGDEIALIGEESVLIANTAVTAVTEATDKLLNQRKQQIAENKRLSDQAYADFKKKQEDRDKEILKQNEDVYNQKQSYQIHSEEKLNQEKIALEKKHNEELSKIQHLRNEDIIYFDKEGKQQVANQYKDQKALLDIYFNEQKRIKDEQIALNQEFNSFDFEKVADNILRGTDKLENYEDFGDILNFGDNQEKYDAFLANVNKRKQLIEESTIQLDSYQVDTTREVQEKLFKLRTANIERERDLKLQELEELKASEEEKQAVRDYYENLRVKEVENSQKAIESIQELELQGYLSLADGVSGIFDALASQSKEGASLYKGLAIASVMIDTTATAIASYKAMVKQYAEVPGGGTIGVIAGIASAAAITLNGLNAVNKIKRVKTDGSEKGGGGGGGAQMIAPNVQFVSSSENQIANTINDTNEAMNMQETPPIKTYVVANDVSTEQELERNAVNRSSL